MIGFFLSWFRHILRKMRRKSLPVIVRGKNAVFIRPEGIKIFSSGFELTRNAGFHLSWKDSGGIDRNCCNWPIRVLCWERFRVIYEMIHPENRMERICCELFFDSEKKIKFNFRPSFSEKISCYKGVVFLSGEYKHWIAGDTEGAFPGFRGWIRVAMPQKSYSFVGVRSLGVDSFPDIPVIILKTGRGDHYLENSSQEVRARILCCEIPCTVENEEIFGEIFLLKDRDSFLKWCLDHREREK